MMIRELAEVILIWTSKVPNNFQNLYQGLRLKLNTTTCRGTGKGGKGVRGHIYKF